MIIKVYFLINDLIAKVLSNIFKGLLGIIIHFFIVGTIYGFLGILISGLIISLSNIFFSPGDIEILQANVETDPLSVISDFRVLTVFLIVAIVFVAFEIAPILGTIRSSKIYNQAKKNQYQTFGKARFSYVEEVIKTGLKGAGIVFGKMGKKLITKPPEVEGHTLIVGGTGTGKSRGVVIPTLLIWEGSALVMDIKGELSNITSQRRKEFGKVYIFNPEGEGDCYDPIKPCTTVDQAQDLARTLIPIPEKGEPFWAQSAQAILSAFVFEGAWKGLLLSDIAEKLCTTPIGELVEYCRNHEMREVRILASITYDLPEKTLGGVMGELKSKLITIATDQNIRNATMKSDWSAETLEDGATIYLRVSEHLLEQYKDLWTVIISQTLKYLSKRQERKNPPILLAIDEMPRLSKITGLINALATLRSRNVHIMGVIQSMAQLDSLYGKEERKVIADNCRFKLVLSATDPETQKYFSDLAGQQTALAKGITYGAGLVPNSSRNEQGTPLIRPEEWASLNQPILLAPNLQPVKVNLAFWDLENF